MTKIIFVLSIILWILLEFVILVDYIDYREKIVLLTVGIWYPMYPLTYFQTGWLEKLFKKYENWPYYIDLPKLVERVIKWMNLENCKD